MIDTDVIPVRLTLFESEEKLSIPIGEPREYHSKEPRSDLVKVLQRDWVSRHSVKLFDERPIQLFLVGREQLRDRTVVRDQVNQERGAQSIVHYSFLQDVPYVENVAGMLTVQRGAQFSGKDVRYG